MNLLRGMPMARPTAAALALLVGGCDAPFTSAPAPAIGLSAPSVLLQARIVDRDRLEPEVTIVGGASVPMARVGADAWSGSVDVLPDREYTLRIVWVESVPGGERARRLELAVLETPVAVGPDGARLVVPADGYDLSGDLDGDGTGNFAEREAGTDPFGDTPPSDDPVPLDPVPPDPAPPAGDPIVPAPQPPVTPAPPAVEPEPDPVPPAPPAVEPEPVAPTPPVVRPEPLVPVPPVVEPGPLTPVPPVVEPGPLTPVPPVVEPEPVAPEPPSVQPNPGEPRDDGPPPAAQADVIIPRIARRDAPRLDGAGVVREEGSTFWSGEWGAAVQLDTGGSRLGIDRLMIDAGASEADGEPFRFWGAMHDGRYLYVLVVVDDDGFRVRDSDELWNDDSLEVYVDGDNSKSTSYGADDFHRLLPLIEPGSNRTGVDSGIVNGFFSSQERIEIDFATGPGIGPRGQRRPRYEQDVYELRIELDSANIVPGRPFGFELQVNDDDDGGDRDAKWGWAHPSRDGEDIDFTYLDPSRMGTAILE